MYVQGAWLYGVAVGNGAPKVGWADFQFYVRSSLDVASVFRNELYMFE